MRKSVVIRCFILIFGCSSVSAQISMFENNEVGRFHEIFHFKLLMYSDALFLDTCTVILLVKTLGFDYCCMSDILLLFLYCRHTFKIFSISLRTILLHVHYHALGNHGTVHIQQVGKTLQFLNFPKYKQIHCMKMPVVY